MEQQNNKNNVTKKPPEPLGLWEAPKLFSLKEERIETGATPAAAENTGGLWSS